jgi:O-acetyl-ADP-ribose deacetylase (regulator of RNase III)
MIRFVSGNLLEAQTPFLAQGVATGSREGLGTGLALKISTKWPEVQQQFKQHTRNHSFAGGDLFVVPPTAERPGVIYLATQPNMYRATKSYLNRGLRNLVKFCDQHQVESVALPKIGAGLGKLDWMAVVRPLLIKHLAHSATEFVIFEYFRLEDQRRQLVTTG